MADTWQELAVEGRAMALSVLSGGSLGSALVEVAADEDEARIDLD